VLAACCAWRVTIWPDFKLKGGSGWWRCGHILQKILLPLLRGARDAAAAAGDEFAREEFAREHARVSDVLCLACDDLAGF